MKKFNGNLEAAKKSGEQRLGRLFSGKSLKKHEIIGGAAIFIFAVLHFISPIILPEYKVVSNETSPIKNDNKESNIENLKIKENLKIQPDSDKKPLKIESDAVAENVEIGKTPAPVSKNVQNYTKAAAPRAAARKKESPRESRAERLRRAERILTGV